METVFDVVERPLVRMSLAESTHAQQAVNAMNVKLRPHFARWKAELLRAMNSTEPYPVRLRQLYKVSDEMTGIAAEFSICKRGCSHCCNMATLIAEPEAAVIGRAIGVTPRKPKQWPFYSRQGIAKETLNTFAETFHGYAKPCPFLKKGECSIYENRPFACRVHVNMAPTADSCKMDQGRETAMMDLSTLNDAYAWIGKTIKVQDIRAYFPKGLGK